MRSLHGGQNQIIGGHIGVESETTKASKGNGEGCPLFGRLGGLGRVVTSPRGPGQSPAETEFGKI